MPAQSDTTPRRILHLLPALQLDPFDQCVAQNISLSVSASWLSELVVPDEGWLIHHPYPNPLFFVGGSSECHLGHFIHVPADLSSGEIQFHWTVSDVRSLSASARAFQVTHRIQLRLDPSQHHQVVWSMDVANWWAQSEFSSASDTPQIGYNRFSRLNRSGISSQRHAATQESTQNGYRHLDIQESLTLPPISLNDCWTVATYGGPSVHDLMERLS